VTIGQGVHTRFSYVLVENCFFSDKRGDNDDIDMYGESVPVPLIRNNLFLSGHEDKINPTRCSAIIINNIIMGSDDHGIVLRDAGRPIVMNNFIFNCSSAGISVQNQCDALIANNTIVNCQRGIRLFDHFDRHGPPYCLFPGSGRATAINNIIWDCPRPFELTDSPDGNSFVNTSFSNVEGGQAASSVSANSTLLWGLGNIDSDPQFVNLTTNNYRLLSNSPSIDTGTNVFLAVTNFSVSVTNDIDGTARPLDGNGDGLARFDIGAHEFLLATADSNGDGIPDGWAQRFGFNAVDPDLGAGNTDNDPHTNFEEWVADTNPTNALSWFRIHMNELPAGWDYSSLPLIVSPSVSFMTSSNRQYSLLFSTNLTAWTNVPGQVDVTGTGAIMGMSDTNSAPYKFYKVRVELP
jgi:parallel beta-helix repeat protein